MALDLGDLVARVRVDTRTADSDLSGFDKRAQQATGKAGQSAGSRFGRELGSGVESGSRSAGEKAASNLTNPISSAAKKVGAIIAGGFVLDKLKNVATFGLQIASQNEQARISFGTMLGSAQKAGAFIKDLQQFAAKTPFDFPGLQQSASSLISVGINAKDVIPIMTTLGNVTSGMGTGAEGIQRATVALQQMTAAQKISAEDLNQLRDAGIPVYDLLSKAMGKSKSAVVKLAQSGGLGKKALDQMMGALKSGKGLERFQGLMDKQSQSLQGLWSTVQDTFGQGLAKAIAPSLPIIKKGITAVTNMIGPAMSGVGRAVSKGLDLGRHIGGDIRDVWPKIKSAAVAVFGYLKDKILPPVVNGFKGLWDAAKPLFPALKDVGGALLPLFQQAGGSPKKSGPGILADAFTLLQGAVKGIVKPVTAIADFAAKHGDSFRVMALGVGGLALAFKGLMVAHEAQQKLTAAGGLIKYLKSIRLVQAATKVWAAMQWALNAAMDANPIVLVALGVAALVAGFIIAYKKSETFRKIVQGALRGVQVAAEAVAHWFTGKFVPFFTKSIPDAFRSVLSWVKQHWPLIVGLLINPIATVSVLLIHKYHTQIVGFFSGVWSWVKGTFRSAWNGTKNVLAWPVNEGRRLIGVGITGVRNSLGGARDWATGTFKSGWNRLQGILTTPVDLARKTIIRILDGIKTTFRNDLAVYGRIWSGLKHHIVGPVQDALTWLGGHFVSPIKGLLNGVGLGSLASKLPAFGGGGTVPGNSPHDTADDIPAMLTAKEFVTRRPSAEKMRRNHPGALEHINRTGELPKYGLGGFVGDVWGGVKHAAGSILGSLNPATLFEKLAEKLLSGAPGGMWGQVGLKVAESTVGGLVGKVKDMLGSVFGGAGSGPLGGSGLVSWMGGRFTENFANHLKRAFALAPFSIFQGGWNPGGVAASGHTHDKDAVDVGPATLAIQNALRANGVAAWIRTPAEGFIYHIHGVPLPGAGTPSPSAAWQAQDYLRGGNGLLKGTRYASAGIHALSEDGRPELVVGPQLRRLNAGSRVYNAEQTAAMLEGGQTGAGDAYYILALDPIATGRELEKVLLKTGRSVGGVNLSRQPAGVSLR